MQRREFLKNSMAVSLTGLLLVEQGECLVGSNKDCRRSELCKYERKCLEKNGYCVKKK